MFSNGLGFQANYTYVKSSLTYDNMGLGNQFALVGLSNSANLVGIYEDQKWSIRLAYNWRGEFLASVADNGKPNPRYVEPYGQTDLSIGYNVNKNLSVSLEAINLTDSTQRTPPVVRAAPPDGPFSLPKTGVRPRFRLMSRRIVPKNGV